MTSRLLDDPTIDPAEVAHYTSLAHTWWDPKGPFWPLHKLNELRAAFIHEHLCAHFGRDAHDDQALAGLTVLDVGCGGGILSESMATMGATVRGIDVVEKNIRVARLHAAERDLSIDYRLHTVADEVAANNHYDVVLNMEVVEHVADVAAFMRDCGAAVNESGVMFVATINRTFKSWLFAIVGAEYVLRLLPRGTHRWRDFQDPARIISLLGDAGLHVEERTGVAMNPLARALYFVRSMAVNYMLFATRRPADS
ncbi:MAG: bifunctional 2-polyprenyl-6-hydroxyphenol methylase/3-demethylubiquinol 3-O-methyltransferase UbiG [Pseudomonadota bacterium]